MRLFKCLLLYAVLCAPMAKAQETPEKPEERSPTDELEPIIIYTLSDRVIDLTTPHALVQKQSPWKAQWDDWYVVPQLTVSLNKGNGFFVPRYWYRVQDERIDIRTRTVAGDLRGNRFFAAGQLTQAPKSADFTSRSLEFRITPIRLWRIRPGFGYTYNDSNDEKEVFTSGDFAIVTETARTSGAYVADLGIGGYHRSYLRLVGMYGNVRVISYLEPRVGGTTRESPLTLRNDDNSDFTAFGAQAAHRRWGFSLEGSVIKFWPQWTSIAMPHDSTMTNVTASYMMSLSILHLGIFAQTTRISNVPVGTRSSLRFINDGWTYGLSARVP